MPSLRRNVILEPRRLYEAIQESGDEEQTAKQLTLWESR